MELLVAGVSHHTAPLALRERLALSGDEVPRALSELVRPAALREGLVLSTCNRTEIYGRPEGPGAARRLAAFLRDLRPEISDEVDEHAYLVGGRDALKHLFRVVSGLDSMVLGEVDIARQVSDAYRVACSAGTAGPLLHRAVPRALQVGKRVRTETAIAQGIASVAGAAVGLAGRVFRQPETCSVVALGAGRTVVTALRALRSAPGAPLVVLNRTRERAEAVAAQFGGTSAPLEEIARRAAAADIVVAATGSPLPLLVRSELAPLLGARGSRPLLILDLGVPRDVEASIGELDGVYLHDVDDLRAIADRGRSARLREIPKAEAIVEIAVTEFEQRRRRLESEPAIRALLGGMLEIRRAVIDGERNLSDAEREAASRVSGRIIDRLVRRLAPRIKDGTAPGLTLLDAFGFELGDQDGDQDGAQDQAGAADDVESDESAGPAARST